MQLQYSEVYVKNLKFSRLQVIYTSKAKLFHKSGRKSYALIQIWISKNYMLLLVCSQ